MREPVRFEDLRVGLEVPSLSKVVRREDVKAYADASGDQNPLHQSDEFARAAGFPGIIAHGMFTMAHPRAVSCDGSEIPGPCSGCACSSGRSSSWGTRSSPAGGSASSTQSAGPPRSTFG